MACPYLAGVPDDLDPDDLPEDEDPEPDPTPAERLLYALGQLYRRWHNGELPVCPHDFHVGELARTIGVSRDIDMASEESYGTAFYFSGEVLVVLPMEKFPWAIWTVEHWAFYSELWDFA